MIQSLGEALSLQRTIRRMLVDVSLEKKSLGCLMECFKLKKEQNEAESVATFRDTSAFLSWTTRVVTSVSKNGSSVRHLFHLSSK